MIKFITRYFFVLFFNLFIFLGFVSEEYIESILGPIIDDFCILPVKSMIERYKSNPDDPTIKDEIMSARKMSIEMTDSVCEVVVWNRTICNKISQKILKEKFRKLSWELRCAGLNFSIEV